MSTNKQEQLKIKFDHNWSCCSTDDIDINLIINKGSNDNLNWISIQLPHIIDNNEQEINHTSSNKTRNWWYRKQFYWKTHVQNSDQRFYLIFESDQNIDENSNNYSSVDTLMVWLNEIQIFSDSFQSPKLSIDLTEQLICKDDSDKTNRKNTLIVCSKNASLSLHTYLLLSRGMTHAIEEEEIDNHTDTTSNTLSIRKNRVLDYLVGFNDTDGRFDIGSSSRLKTPTICQLPYPSHIIEQENMEGTSDRNSNTLTPTTKHALDYLVNFNHIEPKHRNSPDIIVSEDHDQEDEKLINSNESSEELYVPRLTIVMLIVGSRGDVQPFVA